MTEFTNQNLLEAALQVLKVFHDQFKHDPHSLEWLDIDNVEELVSTLNRKEVEQTIAFLFEKDLIKAFEMPPYDPSKEILAGAHGYVISESGINFIESNKSF